MAAAFSVFLSYRREDTRHLSARIYEQLERHFGDGHVFFDVDSLPRYAGWDFEDVISETVPQCRVFLAIIGRDWARLMRARLRDPKDFVQIELAIALNTPGVRVIPVLVDGAAMPTAADLPEALRGLLGKQNVVLPPDPHLRQAVNDLAKTLLATPAPPVQAAPPPVAPPPPPPKPTALERAEAKAEALMQEKGPSRAGELLLLLGVAAMVAGILVLNRDRFSPPPPAGELVASRPEGGSTPPPSAVPATPPVNGGREPFVDARTTPASTRAPLVTNPASLPDFALFRECEGCPEMVVIPAGSFQMGSPASEAGRDEDEDTQAGAGGGTLRVSIRRFAISRFETTWDEWTACVNAGACNQGGVDGAGGDAGWGRGRRPVTRVDWNDAGTFAGWVNGRSRGGYRRPTEAEWEFAARAGTTSRFSWGDDDPTCDQQARNGANFTACTDDRTRPVGSFRVNPWGLFDMHGNVWEWVADCYNDSLANTPTNGAASATGGCAGRVYRGGSWNYNPQILRSANRNSNTPTNRYSNVGFRLSRTL